MNIQFGVLRGVGLLPPAGRVFREATAGHALTACLAIALNAAGGVFVVAGLPATSWPIGILRMCTLRICSRPRMSGSVT